MTKLSLPFENEWFVLNGGDTQETNGHHGNKSQNYAFDFCKVDDKGLSHKSDGKLNSDYYAFGQPILAPADGTVIEVVDGVTDNEPNFGNYLAGAGNYIMIEHRPGEISFIAHLQQGSIAVKRDQKVKRGKLLGKCGNSGTSFAPHVHYHLQDQKVFVAYTSTYDRTDASKGNFPIKIDLAEIAAGIKVQFSELIANGETKTSYSPVRGDTIKPLKAGETIRS